MEASYGVAKGRANNVQSPSPVTEPPARETAWPGVTTAAAWGPGWPPTPPSSPCEAAHQIVFKTTAAALVAQLQLQLQFCICLFTLGVMILTAQSLVPVECCLFFQCLTILKVKGGVLKHMLETQLQYFHFLSLLGLAVILE